jgi:cob(I)alamin adenosyltransferase
MPDTVHERQGLLIVYTGNGKGKTTAALGLALRARGWNQRVCVIQFIKKPGQDWGELRSAGRLELEWHTLGSGFVFEGEDCSMARDAALAGWALARQKIASGAYDLVVLDEMTYLLKWGWLDMAETLTWLEANRPPATTVVITGRDAPAQLIEAADLATEMHCLKHPYNAGVPAQPGIEY